MMNHRLSVLALACCAAAFAPHATANDEEIPPGNGVVPVRSIQILDFDFVVSNEGGLTFPLVGKTVLGDAFDLLAGGVDPKLTFGLNGGTPDFNPGANRTDYDAAAGTSAASVPATIDLAGGPGSLTVNLSTWTLHLAGANCTSPFPTCAPIDQGAVVTGDWDAATQNFTLSWSKPIAQHPFNGTVGVWTLTGSAQPVPEPGTIALLLAGLGLVGAAARRRG